MAAFCPDHHPERFPAFMAGFFRCGAQASQTHDLETMTKPHRYRQDGLRLPGAEAREYSPKGLELAGPEQGWLALDGAVLGPLFNEPEEE